MTEIRITDLDRCPSSLALGHHTFSKAAAKILFDGHAVSHILPFSSPSAPDSDALMALKNAGRLSLSGAQPKFGLVVDGTNLRYSEPTEQSTYIMKPRPNGYHLINHDFCAANEHLTMQLASQVYGVETAANGMFFFSDGQPAYVVRRFDVGPGGIKYAQEDFASLLGLSKDISGSDFKYSNGSYEECAEIIRRYVKAAAVDILRFFRQVVFNFITLNDDAHLKNLSLINRGGEFRLSPAYDLVNTAIHLYEPRIFALDRGLFKEGMKLTDTRQVTRGDFIEFGRRIGLPEKMTVKQIDAFSAPNPKADDLIMRSFLSDNLKRSYTIAFHYRQGMLRH